MATANPSLPRAAAPAPAPQSAGAAVAPADDISPYRWLILIGLVTASIMEVLDTTIVNVALPQMAGNLGATNTEIGWVSTGYILSNVVVLPMTAWLASVFGRRRYLLGSIALFIVASFFCGTSHGLVELVFWRIMQGAGGAALLSTAQATLREIFPKEQQATVQSIFILGIVVAPTLGPTLGGWITDNYSWQWVFYINIPIGIASMFITGTFLEDSKFKSPSKGIDVPGILLLMFGLGSLQYVLEEGNQDDWFQDPLICWLSVVAGVCIVGLVVWELWPTNKNPVVNFRILKNAPFRASLLLFLALGFGLYGGIFLFPLFVQSVLRFTPTETGLTLLPGGIATAISSIICGRLLSGEKPKVDPRALILFGVALFIYSMWELSHLTTQSGTDDTRFALIIRGFALGFLFAPINFVSFAALSGPEIAQGSGLINLVRQLGGSFGIAILGTYVTNMTKFHQVNLSQYIYPGNPILEQRLQNIIGLLVSKGYSQPDAQNAAYGVLSRQVGAQALTQAYDDAFLLILLAFVFTAPFVFLLTRGKDKQGGGGPPADAH